MSAKAYKNLKLQLGYQNAVLEFQELGSRELRRNAEDSKRPDLFMDEVCERHGITVSLMDSRSSERTMGRIRVLLCLGALESYFHELRAEIIDLGGAEIFVENAKFDDILQVFAKLPHQTKYHRLLHKVVLYFHSVRNEAAHPFDLKGFAGQVATRADDVNSCEAIDILVSRYSCKEVPRSSNHMSFGDYILCGRIAKDYAFEVWQLLTPSLRTLPAEWRWKSRFADLQHRKQRLKTACISDIRTKLGLDFTDSTRLYDLFMEP